jgi:hypothetical protein
MLSLFRVRNKPKSLIGRLADQGTAKSRTKNEGRTSHLACLADFQQIFDTRPQVLPAQSVLISQQAAIFQGEN